MENSENRSSNKESTFPPARLCQLPSLRWRLPPRSDLRVDFEEAVLVAGVVLHHNPRRIELISKCATSLRSRISISSPCACQRSTDLLPIRTSSWISQLRSAVLLTLLCRILLRLWETPLRERFLPSADPFWWILFRHLLLRTLTPSYDLSRTFKTKTMDCFPSRMVTIQ